MLLKTATAFLMVLAISNFAYAEVDFYSVDASDEFTEEFLDDALLEQIPFEYLAAKSSQVGMEDVLLYHRSVIQVGQDLDQWISAGKPSVVKVAQSADAKACYAGRGTSYCEKAINALLPYSLIPLKDKKIFDLGRKLKNGDFEFQVGVRIFKLTSALSFFVKENTYNGVKAPSVASSASLKRFISAIQEFHENKIIDLRKGRTNIPPLARSAR